MGLIQAISGWFQPKAENYGPGHDFWYSSDPSDYHSGFNVSPDNSMKITAVYACIRLLSDSIASLPLDMYKRIPGGKELAPEHDLFDLLKYQPNDWMDAYLFWERAIIDCNTHGAFYAVKNFKRGRIASLEPLLPGRITVEKLDIRKLRFKYKDEFTGQEKTYLQEHLFRIPMFCGRDGFTPVSAIRYNADAISITEATEKFAASFFRNGATPGGSIEAPESVRISPEDRKAIAESWNRNHQGPRNAFKIAVLDQGLKFNPINLSNEDSQLLESRRFQLSDIARIYRIPLHMIQELSKATFNNIEHQSLDFAIHTIRPWTRRIQHAVRRDLLHDEEKKTYFAEFNLNDLMSADARSRGEFYASGIQNGYMTRNEVRARENLNPIDGLDEPLQPLNMVTQEEKERELKLKEKQVEPQNIPQDDETEDDDDA